MSEHLMRFALLRRQRSSHRRSKGLSLIELMVSVAIGLVLVLTMLVLYTNIARNQTQLGNTGRQVENGKFALQLLQEDLTHAGFWGDYLPRFDDKGLPVPDDIPTALQAPCISYPDANWSDVNIMGIAVQGYADVPAGCTTLLTNEVPSTPSENPTDVLLIRYVENCFAGETNPAGDPICDADQLGRLYFQSSRCSAEIGSGNVFVLNTAGFTLRSNIKCPAVAVPADTLAAKRRFISHIYYVRNFSVTTGDGIPTLMRSSFNLNGTNLAHQVPQALIEGIQGFRLEYGIDNKVPVNGTIENVNYGPGGTIVRGDGIPDVYITCPKADGTDCSVNDMFHVVSARIHVLARNLEPTPGHVDAKTYVLAGVPYGPFNDAFVRRAYSTTVRLMNPAGRREP